MRLGSVSGCLRVNSLGVERGCRGLGRDVAGLELEEPKAVGRILAEAGTGEFEWHGKLYRRSKDVDQWISNRNQCSRSDVLLCI